MLRYNIGSSEFSLVNEDWFIRKAIYAELFSILNFNIDCSFRNNQRSLFDKNSYCEHKNNDVESFLLSLGFCGYNNDEFF